MAVDIVRYHDTENETIVREVVSSVVPRTGETADIGSDTYQLTDISYRIAERLGDFLDRDGLVHIAIVAVEPIEIVGD
jgi:hypothetical protein